MIYTLWKKDCDYVNGFKKTSGNDEHSTLFPLGENADAKFPSSEKTVVPQLSGTTQDELRYNESHEALFP